MANTDTTVGRPANIRLPDPATIGGMPLLDAIKARHSTRKYSPTPLSIQELSDILWAAYGLTREYAGTGIRTTGSHAAPAAHNWQELDLYVATTDGLYRYDWRGHRLDGVLGEDIRHLTAHEEQPFVLEVPVILIYVADLPDGPLRRLGQKRLPLGRQLGGRGECLPLLRLRRLGHSVPGQVRPGATGGRHGPGARPSDHLLATSGVRWMTSTERASSATVSPSTAAGRSPTASS